MLYGPAQIVPSRSDRLTLVPGTNHSTLQKVRSRVPQVTLVDGLMDSRDVGASKDRGPWPSLSENELRNHIP